MIEQMTTPTYPEKLLALRDVMQEHGVQGYMIPKADEYQGEFVAGYAERLKYLTGFTGSAGMAVVFDESAGVLTDSRYIIQVRDEVDGALFKTGNYVDTPIGEWITKNAGGARVIGYDPMLFTTTQIDKIASAVEASGIELRPIHDNLIDQIWKDQPSPPETDVFVFPHEIAGMSASEKAQMVAGNIKTDGALITLPDSIAWLLNVRGGDVGYIPLAHSTVLVKSDGAVVWFINTARVSDDVRAHIGDHVSIYDPLDYQDILQDLSGSTLSIDGRYVPMGWIMRMASFDIETTHEKDPCIRPKAQKTPAEQEAIKRAHIIDGVAVTKFLHWVEMHGDGASELDSVTALRGFREEHVAFKTDSFPTIAGFGEHGAIVHYRPTPRLDKTIEQGSLLLVDSGGQYADGHEGGEVYGTTDITRTVAIGTPSDEMRENFTRVLKGHIAVAMATFSRGTIGVEIDTLARAPLKEVGLDFAHGTGHGVGCYLAVHEEAAGISPRGKDEFLPGMLLSNEPGYYKEDAYGIRIENLVFVQDTDDGQMCFETISYAPIDQSLIVVDMLSADERAWLNDYHEQVFIALSPNLDRPLRDWLREQTRPI